MTLCFVFDAFTEPRKIEPRSPKKPVSDGKQRNAATGRCSIVNTRIAQFLGQHTVTLILRLCGVGWYGLRTGTVRVSVAPSVTGFLILLVQWLANLWMK